ncbi:MAG TPA: hypothetical protein VFK81_12235 [Terriglobales bacterium]|jgi:hypothetical protein|nr:hypothetical protein [Terriglobales bacterium]
MTGVGKTGLIVLLLALCAPGAARLSRHSASGRAVSLPGWLINICHHRSGPRGTQRRNSHHPTEPFNAVVERESRGDFYSDVIRPQAVYPEVAAVPALIFPLISITQASPISDPAFRCTFLI